MKQQRNKMMERETTKEVESGNKGDREGGGDSTMENQQQRDEEIDRYGNGSWRRKRKYQTTKQKGNIGMVRERVESNIM